MAARGLVNGRGPPRSGGRDSAKRVVSDTYTPGCTEGTVPIFLIYSFYFTDTLYLLEFLDQTVQRRKVAHQHCKVTLEKAAV